MARRFYALFAGLLLTTSGLSGQEGPAVFDSREWDFGAIREADGVVRHDFLLFNRSDRPFRVERAIPGCSCINASLPRGTVAPGESAAVEVAFTPAGAAGTVQRTVEIVLSGGQSAGVLSVSADVLPADRSIHERYPVVLAEGLYASRADINFGYLERGRSTGKAFFVANAGKQPMYLRAAGLEGSAFRANYPGVLSPGEETRVEIWCDTPADPDYFATLRATLELTPDGKEPLRIMPLTGLCLTEAPDTPDAPRLRVPSVRLERKLLSRTPRGSLEISNDGASPLIIHAIELPYGLTVRPSEPGLIGRLLGLFRPRSDSGDSRSGLDPDSLRIPPGQTLKLTLELSQDAGSTSGTDPGPAPEFRLTLFSNDPLRPAKEMIIQTP